MGCDQDALELGDGDCQVAAGGDSSCRHNLSNIGSSCVTNGLLIRGLSHFTQVTRIFTLTARERPITLEVVVGLADNLAEPLIANLGDERRPRAPVGNVGADGYLEKPVQDSAILV